MKYINFEVSIASVNGALRFFDVLAVDYYAALADVKAMYGDEVEIVCLWVK